MNPTELAALTASIAAERAAKKVAPRASTRRDGVTYRGVVRVGSKVTAECPHCHDNRDQNWYSRSEGVWYESAQQCAERYVKSGEWSRRPA